MAQPSALAIDREARHHADRARRVFCRPIIANRHILLRAILLLAVGTTAAHGGVSDNPPRVHTVTVPVCSTIEAAEAVLRASVVIAARSQTMPVYRQQLTRVRTEHGCKLISGPVGELPWQRCQEQTDAHTAQCIVPIIVAGEQAYLVVVKLPMLSCRDDAERSCLPVDHPATAAITNVEREEDH